MIKLISWGGFLALALGIALAPAALAQTTGTTGTTGTVNGDVMTDDTTGAAGALNQNQLNQTQPNVGLPNTGFGDAPNTWAWLLSGLALLGAVPLAILWRGRQA